MFDLFYEGGPHWMTMVSIVLLIGLVLITKALVDILNGEEREKIYRTLGYVRSVGLLGLMVGVLTQMLDLYSIFQAIEKAGEVTQSLLVGGLKISSISLIYGIISFVICYVLHFGLLLVMNRK